jgi:hypothetical protein
MLVFIVMYVLLVPLTVWLEERRDQDKERTECECCLFVFYIFFQILLSIGMIFFVVIALGGIPILFYLLNGIAKTHPMTQHVFFWLVMNSLVSPYVVMIVTFAAGKVFGCGEDEEM